MKAAGINHEKHRFDTAVLKWDFNPVRQFIFCQTKSSVHLAQPISDNNDTQAALLCV
jgi:hypothetical protein